MHDPCPLIPNGARAGTSASALVVLAQTLVTSQEFSHHTPIAIDNNSDNNPRRHRWTQDDIQERQRY
jgi:hypothetical protein